MAATAQLHLGQHAAASVQPTVALALVRADARARRQRGLRARPGRAHPRHRRRHTRAHVAAGNAPAAQVRARTQMARLMATVWALTVPVSLSHGCLNTRRIRTTTPALLRTTTRVTWTSTSWGQVDTRRGITGMRSGAAARARRDDLGGHAGTLCHMARARAARHRVAQDLRSDPAAHTRTRAKETTAVGSILTCMQRHRRRGGSASGAPAARAAAVAVPPQL